MGSKKTKVTNEHKYMTPPNTADQERYRQLGQSVDLTSPIVSAFGQAENDIDDQVFETDLPEGVRDRVKLGQLFNLRMQKGGALADAKGREHMMKTGNAGTLAGMTAPQLVNSGSTTVQPFNWGGLLGSAVQGGATVGAAAL